MRRSLRNCPRATRSRRATSPSGPGLRSSASRGCRRSCGTAPSSTRLVMLLAWTCHWTERIATTAGTTSTLFVKTPPQRKRRAAGASSSRARRQRPSRPRRTATRTSRPTPTASTSRRGPTFARPPRPSRRRSPRARRSRCGGAPSAVRATAVRARASPTRRSCAAPAPAPSRPRGALRPGRAGPRMRRPSCFAGTRRQRRPSTSAGLPESRSSVRSSPTSR